MFCYPSKDNIYVYIIPYGQDFGILFRSVEFLMHFKKLISVQLRDLQKMAASRPISLLTLIKTFLISLNNNFGTLTLVLGCFPFDIQPYHSMSDNSIFIFAISSLHTHR